MKVAVFAAVLAVVFALASCRPDAVEKYESKYDDKDVNELLNNKEALSFVSKCLIDQGPCDSDEAKLFKEIFSGSIKDDCARCTDKQRANLSKFIFGVKEKDPEAYEAIGKFYNPDGKYDDKYKKFLQEHQHQ